MEEHGLIQQGVDSRAMLATFMTKLPKLFILAVAGAVVGSGLNLLITLAKVQDICYVSRTEYYIEFAEGRYEARDYYNAFTWNTAVGGDEILGRAMVLLGDGYERGQVREMVRADILSDVRYLTLTVKGQDPAQVEVIKDALAAALGEFGAMKKEFDSIYKIEDAEIVREEIPHFAWRAALLGAVIAAGVGIFVTALRFCMGSVFYTKNDIAMRLGLPVSGMTFRDGRRSDRIGAMEQRQAEMLEKSLKALMGEYSQILLLDASGGQDASVFLRAVCDRGMADGSRFQVCDAVNQNIVGAAVVAVIPFGKIYRERIADEIDYARQYGGKVVAAVLTQADRNWMKIYYGR